LFKTREMREGKGKCELGKNKRKWDVITLKEQDVVK